MSTLLLRQLFDSQSSTYTYLVADSVHKKAAFIDPVIENIDQYQQLLNELELDLIAALDTHTHADHISAIGALRDKFGSKSMLGAEANSDCVSETFSDGSVIAVGDVNITAIYTPGHTDDSYSFLIEDDGRRYLFTGDTLLIRGSGRTDFQNGDALEQYSSITKKLLSYDDFAVVYPGHDYRGWTSSTIGEERKSNPRLQVSSAEQYREIMDNLKLANPKLMDVAVPANQSCGKLL